MQAVRWTNCSSLFDTGAAQAAAVINLNTYIITPSTSPHGLARFAHPETAVTGLREGDHRWRASTHAGVRDVQRVKAVPGDRSTKTVDNVLTVLSVLLRTAVECDRH